MDVFFCECVTGFLRKDVTVLPNCYLYTHVKRLLDKTLNVSECSYYNAAFLAASPRLRGYASVAAYCRKLT